MKLFKWFIDLFKRKINQSEFEQQQYIKWLERGNKPSREKEQIVTEEEVIQVKTNLPEPIRLQGNLVRKSTNTGLLSSQRGLQSIFNNREVIISQELKDEIQCAKDEYDRENGMMVSHQNPDVLMKRDAVQKIREFNEEFNKNPDVGLIQDDYIPTVKKKKKKKENRVIKIS